LRPDRLAGGGKKCSIRPGLGKARADAALPGETHIEDAMDVKYESRRATDSWLEGARARPIAAAATIAAILGAATILGAWFFQYVIGLKPCPLCLEQRYVYYFGIPLAVMVLLGEGVGASRRVLLAGLIAIALGMLGNAGLATYHAGIEWHWWQGPPDCSGPLESLHSQGGLLRDLQQNPINVVRCDEAAWRFLGLSLAGYDALISLAMAAVAAWGAWMAWKQSWGE
jgi:disulfide bond formation protein DsbB